MIESCRLGNPFRVPVFESRWLFYFCNSIFTELTFYRWSLALWKLSYFYFVSLYFLLIIRFATFAILYSPLLIKSLAKWLGLELL